MMLMPRRNDFDFLDDIFEEPMLKHRDIKLMKTDIREDDNNFYFEMDLPGFEKSDIKISVESGYLTVQTHVNKEKNKEVKDKYIQKERFTGDCYRNFYLGEDIKEEEIKAVFRNGILELVVPKKVKEEEIPTKKYIEIED